MFPFTKLANLLEMFDWYQHFWMRLSQNLLILQMKWSLTLTVWFFLLKPVFNTFQQRWKVLIRLSVHDLTLVNILQMSWNRCMSFISGIEWTALKMVYIRLMIYLRKHTKFFRYITVYGGKYIKIILLHLGCIDYTITNMCLIH